MLIFLGIPQIQEVHLQGDRGQVAARGVLCLRRFPKIDEALFFRFRMIFVVRFSGLGNGQVHPFGMGIAIQTGAVHVQFRQIQHVAVPVLSGWQNTGGHAGLVHVVGNAQQIFSFTNLYIRIPAHTLNQIHVVPVPGQFAPVFACHAVLSQQSFHRIDVLKRNILGCTGKIGIEAEAVRRQAALRQSFYHGGSGSGGRGAILPHHIVQQVVENVTGIYRDPAQLRHDTVNAEGLVPQRAAFRHGANRLCKGGFRAAVPEKAAVHIAPLAVRQDDLVPAGVGRIQHIDGRAVRVLLKNLVTGSGTGSQPQSTLPDGGVVLVRIHRVHVAAVFRAGEGGGKVDCRSHGGGNGRPQDIPFRQAGPPVVLVDGMNQRQLPFPVEGFRDSAGKGPDHAQAVVGKIGAVGRINADHDVSPPFRQ